jgi:hypothetical protein
MERARHEKRKYVRYDTELKIYFKVDYSLKTKVEFQILDRRNSYAILSKKYPAVSKNVNVEGLCFTSEKKLKRGDFLYLEVYLPKAKSPIIMEGKVRWSGLSPGKKNKFDTGVKLNFVEGRLVKKSIYYDKENRVFWSVVLETVFSTFKKLTQKIQK